MPVFRQKSLANVSRRLRSPGCCQVTFNSEQICRMCCLALKCLPRVLGADCQDKEISFICMAATRQYPPLRRGIFVAGGSGLLTRRCAEKAPKYSRWWRLARWERNLFIFKRCQVHRWSELGQAQVSMGAYTRTGICHLLWLCRGCFKYFRLFHFICLIVTRTYCSLFVADWPEKGQ